MAKRQAISLDELEKALDSADEQARYDATYAYAHAIPTPEAIPVLCRALSDTYPGVARYAAVALGALGPAASDAKSELRLAGIRVDTATEMPQAYVECLAALIKIDPRDELTLGMIQDHIGLSNWYPLKASLTALKTIGTEEALDLLVRAIAFWTPELDKKQMRIVQEIAAGLR